MDPAEEARAAAYRAMRRARADRWRALRARLAGNPDQAAAVRADWRPFVLGMRDLRRADREPETEFPDDLRANHP